MNHLVLRGVPCKYQAKPMRFGPSSCVNPKLIPFWYTFRTNPQINATFHLAQRFFVCKTKALPMPLEFPFFLVRTEMSWCSPAHCNTPKTPSQNQGSKLSSSTMIPRMTMVADLTHSED